MSVSEYRILNADIAFVGVPDQGSKRLGFWQIAVLTAVGSLGVSTQADAALLYSRIPIPAIPAPRLRRSRNVSATRGRMSPARKPRKRKPAPSRKDR